MADDLSVLFRLKAQNQASPVIHNVQSDVAKLRQSMGNDFNAISQIGTASFSKITQSLTQFTQSIPVVGQAVNGLTSQLGTMATELAATGEASAGTASQLGAVLASMGPVGIAAAGIAIEIAAVAVGFGILVKTGESVAETFFGLAKSAAGFRGELFDLSQQTGVSVETLNALDIAASKTGGSIQSIAQSLVIFQGQIELAQNDTTEMGKKFAQLGISTDNTEQSLRDAVKAIASMEEGLEQTNTAAELFGKRGGKQFLAIIKESGGDIDSVVDKLGDLARVTQEDAKVADDFNDSLRDLNILLRNAIGKEAIPIATDAIRELTRFLKENEGAIHALGSAINLFGTGFVHGFILPITQGLELFNAFVQLTVRAIPGAEALARAYERIANASGRIKPLPGGEVTGGVIGETFGSQVRAGVEGETPAIGGGGGRRRGGGAGSDPAATAKRIADIQLQIVLDALKAEEVATDRSLAHRATNFGAYALEIQRLESERHNAVIDGLDAEAAAAEKLRSVQARQVAEAEIERKRKQEDITHQQRQQELADKFAERVQIITDFIRDQNKAIAEAASPTNRWMAAIDNLIESLAKQGTTLSPVIEQTLRFNAAMAIAAESTRTLAESVADLAAQQANLSDLKLPEGFNQGAVIVPNIEDFGLPPEAPIISLADAFDRLGQSMSDVFNISKENGQVFSDILGGAIDDLARGVGNLVENWVLLGSTGPQAMRRLVSSVLAGVAAQAAVKAIYELAEGFAALFFNPAAAAAHFTAAALFGSIAGVSAIAGRAVAGDAFQHRGSTSSRGGSSAQPLNTTITTGRNQAPVTVHVKVTHAEGMVAKIFADDFNNGGITREVIANDGR